MRRWLHKNPRLRIGLLLLAPFMIAAAVPGLIAQYSPTDLVAAPFEPPSSEFWLGTDELGRDILSCLVFAARTDIKISLGATLLAGAAVFAPGERRWAGLPVTARKR